MLEFEGLNYWAVAVAWLISVVVGALWYSPVAFGTLWERYTGIDILKMPTAEANRTIVSVAVSAAVQVVVLAVVLHSLDTTNIMEGVAAGIVLWAGLVAATTVGVTLYSKRSWKFWWLNSSYFLLVMAVNSVILTMWR